MFLRKSVTKFSVFGWCQQKISRWTPTNLSPTLHLVSWMIKWLGFWKTTFRMGTKWQYCPIFPSQQPLFFFSPGTGINTKGQSSSLGSPSVGSLWWLVVEMTETTWIFVVFSRAEAMEIRLLWLFYCCFFCSLSFFRIQLLLSKNKCTWISLCFTSFTCFLFEVCFVPDALDPASCQGHALQDVVSRVRIPSMALGDGKPLGPPVVAGAIFGTLFVFATKLMGSRNL